MRGQLYSHAPCSWTLGSGVVRAGVRTGEFGGSGMVEAGEQWRS